MEIWRGFGSVSHPIASSRYQQNRMTRLDVEELLETEVDVVGILLKRGKLKSYTDWAGAIFTCYAGARCANRSLLLVLDDDLNGMAAWH